jgi:hypothetical protein
MNDVSAVSEKSLLPIIRPRWVGVEWEFEKAESRRQTARIRFCLCLLGLLLIADDNDRSQRNIACAVFESRDAQCRMNFRRHSGRRTA